MTDSAAANAELSYWMKLANRYPMLTPAEELAAAEQYQAGDATAGDRLLLAHLRLVVKMARGYKGYGIPIADLVNEGNLGLSTALAKFEPARGFRFSTYAGWWVRAEMQGYIMRSRSMVKYGTTAGQKKLFFNLNRARQRLMIESGGRLPPDYAEILARQFDVSAREVKSTEQRLTGDTSLNVTLSEDGEGEMMDTLVDTSPDPEEIAVANDQTENRLAVLRLALKALNPRELRVIEARRLVEIEEALTLEALSYEFGVSRERVRQIEQRAIEKLTDAAHQHARLFQSDRAPRNPNARDFAHAA